MGHTVLQDSKEPGNRAAKWAGAGKSLAPSGRSAGSGSAGTRRVCEWIRKDVIVGQLAAECIDRFDRAEEKEDERWNRIISLCRQIQTSCAQVFVFVSSVQYVCDDPRFVLLGKYCYSTQPSSSTFEDQENTCESRSSYLAGFETLDEQNQLVEYVNWTITDTFKPFYIGLRCDAVFKQWKWINPDIAFNPADATFENRQFDPRICYNDDEDIHFELTPDSKWHEIMINDPDKTSETLVCQRKASEVAPPPYDDTALVIGLGITCMILVVVIIFMCIKFRKKIAILMAQAMQASRERFRDDANVEKAAAEPKDEWEIGRQFLDINYSMKLGTGAFGVVFLGQIDVEYLPKSSERSILQLSSLKRNNGRIAVKMLHESADRLAEVDFLQEIEMMKCIGYHERLVNIIASVTESQPHLLITEYCPNGDLLSYLKQRREYMLELPPNPDYSLVNRSLLITQEQQLQFAVQIAYGLEFLSGRGFVHRDIAARNILVDERNGCKIGDFGLCRRVQQEQELYLSRGGLLPIKWMSPEALRRYEMSTASDVWSYGILLFEIITLGGSPYPNWEPSEILPRLEAGERMERPDNCPDAVLYSTRFDAMTECWCEHPTKRPDFTTLRSRLAKALEESPSEYYLQLDSQRDYYLVPRSKDMPGVKRKKTSKEYYYCDHAGFELVGNYCYYLDDDNDPIYGKIQSTFLDQQVACIHIGAHLPCWKDRIDQQHLVDFVNSKRQGNFDSFFIGLICDTTQLSHWTWIDPKCLYAEVLANFQDLHPWDCTDQENASFLLTPEGKWRELMSFGPNFTPQIAVCQMSPTMVTNPNDIPTMAPSTTSTLTPSPPHDYTVLIISLISAIVILLVLIMIIIWRFRNYITSKQKLKEQMKEVAAEDLSNKNINYVQKSSKDEWEIHRECITISFSDKLGTGAFGVVFIGRLDDTALVEHSELSAVRKSTVILNDGLVAVKMLHEYANKLAEVEFLQEIELMKSIVNIIACVTESCPRLLVTEYCDEGDLLSFLKRRRDYMLDFAAENEYINADKSMIITQEHQLQYAVQIAYGMEYLSSRGFIHRDIAARNILVDSRNGCKVGDFGLCRRIEEEQELYQSRGGRLPIKWMAPEALRRYEMSTASDVWSYGVLIFEVITLGGSPYAGWETTEILPRLEAGDRMGRPDNCPDVMFELMNDCWCGEPQLRPTFTELRQRIAKMMEDSPSDYYLQLDAQRDYYLVPRSRDLPVPEDELFSICEQEGYVLAGAYCYKFETDDARIGTTFDMQNDFCGQGSGHLVGWENSPTLTSLKSLVQTTQGTLVTDFLVGLQCDPENLTWRWVQPSDSQPMITYDYRCVTFEDTSIDPEHCTREDFDKTTSFLLSPRGTLKALSQYRISDVNFKPKLAVCQRLAVADPGAGDDWNDTQPPDYTTLIVALASALTVVIIFTTLTLIKYRRKIKELMTKKSDADVVPNTYVHSPRVEFDCWEIRRPFVHINYDEKLGNGAFGVVHLGRIDVSGLSDNPSRSIIQISELKLNNGRVAIKMLHESADRLSEIEFVQEIEIMKRIGYHDRLVNLVACITESTPNLLITEFCSNGDLLKFMKERRQYMLTIPPNANSDSIDKSLVITQEQQLQYAIQVASGLEYLSGSGYIHRDIAARNILVDERSGCKIGDFGLCRKVQEENEFYHSRGGRFPIKWMSPEALKRYEMSTASDVWSFGILLFEIITLGGSPYPDWEPAEVLPRLEEGERMQRPDNCPDSVFEAMSDCWRIDPSKRPDFSELRSRLGKALEKTPSEYYIQLDSQKDYYLIPRSRDAPIPQEDIFRKVLIDKPADSKKKSKDKNAKSSKEGQGKKKPKADSKEKKTRAETNIIAPSAPSVMCAPPGPVPPPQDLVGMSTKNGGKRMKKSVPAMGRNTVMAKTAESPMPHAATSPHPQPEGGEPAQEISDPEKEKNNVKGRDPEAMTPDQLNNLRGFIAQYEQVGVKGLMDEFNTVKGYNVEPWVTDAHLQNTTKNRYQDIFCIDATRIKLNDGKEGEYIHANLVELPPLINKFITTQGPLENTVDDFWRLVVQENVGYIFMLCSVIELGKKKCEQYVPEVDGEIRCYGDVKVTLEKAITDAHFVNSKLIVEAPGRPKRYLYHHYWRNWPDRGVPVTALAGLRLLRHARTTTWNTIVHCSAGVGRTGTLVAIEWLLQHICTSPPPYDMRQMLRAVRNQRAHAIQTAPQYAYVCFAIFRLFTIIEPSNTAAFHKFSRGAEGTECRARWTCLIRVSRGVITLDDGNGARDFAHFPLREFRAFIYCNPPYIPDPDPPSTRKNHIVHCEKTRAFILRAHAFMAENGVEDLSPSLLSKLLSIHPQTVSRTIDAAKDSPPITRFPPCAPPPLKQTKKAKEQRIVGRFSPETIEKLRRYMHVSFFAQYKRVTLKLIKDGREEWLAESDKEQTVNTSTIRLLLHGMNFAFIKLQCRTSIYMNEYYCSLQANFLRSMLEIRTEGKCLIWSVDETWVHKGMRPNIGWTDKEAQKAPLTFIKNGLTAGNSAQWERGERLVIVACLSEHGFRCPLIWRTGKVDDGGDYHKEMNSEEFEKYIQNVFKELVKEAEERELRPVLLMDNASYHSRVLDKMPTTNDRKAVISDWLVRKGIDCPAGLKKKELVDKLKKLSRKEHNIYIVDKMAEDYGVTLVRTPPYMAEFAPIELGWSAMKRAQYDLINRTDDGRVIREKLLEWMENYPAENCKSYMEHSRKKRIAEVVAQEETSKRGVVAKLRVDNTLSAACNARFSRACRDCHEPDPAERVVLTHCGHAVCRVCADSHAYGASIVCPDCRERSVFVRLFEERASASQEEGASASHSDASLTPFSRVCRVCYAPNPAARAVIKSCVWALVDKLQPAFRTQFDGPGPILSFLERITAEVDEGVWTVPVHALESFEAAVAECNKVLPREDAEVVDEDDISGIDMYTTPVNVEVPYFSPPQERRVVTEQPTAVTEPAE
ncbi:hypothetical protein PRIPAC_86739, partial [Pristionchus pacificus]|uniref:C-type lectin n=1 Tax=Pristionchus pacificus TaxID=54126 RepID=A0A2A6BS68_PRIPA